MQEVTKYPSGTFSWVDLATNDPAGAKAFYTGLFGWTFEDTPIPEGGVYTMLHLNGKPVAALGEQWEAEKEAGVPPHWQAYITVYDIKERTARAAELGGKVIAPPMDVMGQGWMSVLQDPTGAFVSLWEPQRHIGASYVNVPGSLIWNELNTKDAARASEFYTALFGWTASEGASSTGNLYITLMNRDRSAAGIFKMGEEFGDMPAHWMAYFRVEDLQASVAKVTELGGTVIVPPTSAGEVGTFAIITDPQGAALAIIETAMADPPPQAED